MRRVLLFIAWTLSAIVTSRAQNIVGLHNGQELEFGSLKLKEPAFSKSYLLADDSVKYSLDLVKYYRVGSDYYKKRMRHNGSYEFMYREQEGAIELYSVIRTVHSYNPNTGIPYSSSSKLNFYSKDVEGIKKVNGKNLKIDMSECELCLQEVKKAKTLSMISAIGLTAGLGIFIGTAATHLSETPEPGDSSGIPAGAIIGPALCFTPWILSGAKRKHFSNAISIYNERH